MQWNGMKERISFNNGETTFKILDSSFNWVSYIFNKLDKEVTTFITRVKNSKHAKLLDSVDCYDKIVQDQGRLFLKP